MSLADSRTLAEAQVLAPTVNKKALLVAVVGSVVVLDFVTKMWAMNTLTFGYPVPVIGDFFRLTYTHNPGAAFGINIGEHSRVFFLVLSLVALVVLGLIYRSTPASDRLRLLAVALVSAGAIGNIIDRFRFEAGRPARPAAPDGPGFYRAHTGDDGHRPSPVDTTRAADGRYRSLQALQRPFRSRLRR